MVSRSGHDVGICFFCPPIGRGNLGMPCRDHQMHRMAARWFGACLPVSAWSMKKAEKPGTTLWFHGILWYCPNFTLVLDIPKYRFCKGCKGCIPPRWGCISILLAIVLYIRYEYYWLHIIYIYVCVCVTYPIIYYITFIYYVYVQCCTTVVS